MAARHKDTTIENKKKYPYIFLCAKAYRSMTSGCRGTPYFRRYYRELVSKPAISFKEKSGGATVVRLRNRGVARASNPDPLQEKKLNIRVRHPPTVRSQSWKVLTLEVASPVVEHKIMSSPPFLAVPQELFCESTCCCARRTSSFVLFWWGSSRSASPER